MRQKGNNFPAKITVLRREGCEEVSVVINAGREGPQSDFLIAVSFQQAFVFPGFSLR